MDSTQPGMKQLWRMTNLYAEIDGGLLYLSKLGFQVQATEDVITVCNLVESVTENKPCSKIRSK